MTRVNRIPPGSGIPTPEVWPENWGNEGAALTTNEQEAFQLGAEAGWRMARDDRTATPSPEAVTRALPDSVVLRAFEQGERIAVHLDQHLDATMSALELRRVLATLRAALDAARTEAARLIPGDD